MNSHGILIGSSAIKHWFPDFPRTPKDTDQATFKKHQEIIPSIESLENPILFEYQNAGEVLRPNLLATLKASHLCWDINWEKHMFDLQFLLKKGCKINKRLFFRLYCYWNKYHKENKRSDLKMSKEDFFKNAINYSENEHDELHFKLNDFPIYTLILKSGKEVELSGGKFKRLSHNDKLNFVREEVMVMAYERYRHLDYRIAYSKMLKKFIISHVPLFALQFTLENFIELHKPKVNYFKILSND